MDSTDHNIAGLMRVGGVVVLSGPAARCALELVLSAVRSRQRNGLPAARHHVALAQALADATMSANGHADTPEPEPVDDQPTMTIPVATQLLGLSERQVRRLAPRLGGRKAGRQWLLDTQAVREHREALNGP